MKLTLSLAIAALLAAVPGALAGAPKAAGQHEALKSLCSADFHAVCPNADPDSDEAAACVRKNMKELSPGCRDAIAKEEKKSSK